MITTKTHKRSFIADVIKLVSGTTLAQFIALLITPVLTRLYAPEAFGALALFVSITGLVGVVGCMRYDVAILLPENDKDASNLLGLSLGLAVFSSLLVTSILIVSQPRLLNLFNVPDTVFLLWLVPPMILLIGCLNTLNYWNLRMKNFGWLSVVKVMATTSTGASKFVAYYMGYIVATGLIAATVLGQILAVVILGLVTWRQNGLFMWNTIKLREMLNVGRRYYRFPVYNIWSVMLNTASLELPIFLLAYFFSSTSVGFYALGYRVIKLPMQLINNAVASVFFQRTSEIRFTANLDVVAESVLRRLVGVGLFPFFILAIMGQDFFVYIFGSEWSEAGVYAQILSPWLFVTFVVSPFVTLFNVLERQKTELLFNLILLILRAGAFVLGGAFGNVYLALILFSLTGVVTWIWLGVWLLKLIEMSLQRLFVILWQVLKIAFIPFLLIVFFQMLYEDPSFLALTTSILAAGSFYYALLLKEDAVLRRRIFLRLR